MSTANFASIASMMAIEAGVLSVPVSGSFLPPRQVPLVILEMLELE